MVLMGFNVLVAVKILVFLTMPVDPTSDDVVSQIEYLWKVKGGLTRSLTIAVVVSLLEQPLEHLEWLFPTIKFLCLLFLLFLCENTLCFC